MPPPAVRSHSLTDETRPVAENVPSVAVPKAQVPRPARVAGTSGSWPRGGKNGRMIGSAGGGVGKVLHYLDTLRTEVVEADRSLTSLSSDNRFLVSANFGLV